MHKPLTKSMSCNSDRSGEDLSEFFSSATTHHTIPQKEGAMKFHNISRLIFAACFFALALVAAAPGTAIGQIHITSIDQLQKIGDNASYPFDGAYGQNQ